LNFLLPFMFFCKFTNSSGSSQYVDEADSTKPRPTNRDVKRSEGIPEFEHGNKHIKIRSCVECRENIMKIITAETDIGKPFKCDSCKNLCQNYYEDNGLQPIWYERIPNAKSFHDFKLDENGKKIKRYDIPQELATLTISEQLLIRKCAPYIPSVHLSNGFFALTGQCVAFPQQVTEVCTELPRHPDEIVTYIRQLGNSQTSLVHLQHLKVRRDKVIEALRWLKLHHTEYKDITINESNLKWMKDQEETTVLDHVKNYRVKGKQSMNSQLPKVSEVQCSVDNDSPFNLDYAIMTGGVDDSGIDPDQKEMMDDLVDTTKANKLNDKLLMFPPHGDEPVK